MKKAKVDSDELRPEYSREDFGVMVRGKYAARVKEASNVFVLDPDVAQEFPNGQAVNDALRGLIELAQASARLTPKQRQTNGQAAHGESL